MVASWLKEQLHLHVESIGMNKGIHAMHPWFSLIASAMLSESHPIRNPVSNTFWLQKYDDNG